MAARAPLADPIDLGEFVDEAILAADRRAVSVLSIASNLVRAYLRWTDDPDEIPAAVTDVVIDVAARVWINPAGLESDAVDDAQRRFGNKAHERFYLTAANKMMLDPLRPRTGGLYTVSVRDEVAERTVYVPTAPEPSGDPFPWYSTDDPLIR